MKLKSLIVGCFVLVQVAAFTACQTVAVHEGSRSIASSPMGLDAAITSLARSSTLERTAITQIIESQVLQGAKVASVVGTSGEAGYVAALLSALGPSNSALAEKLKLSAASKSQLLVEIRANYNAMKTAAASGIDTGNVAGAGFGIPSSSQAELNSLTARLDAQLKAELATSFQNANVGAQRNPANKATLKKIILTGAKLAQLYGKSVVGELKCVANGDLSDPEALNNFASILDKMTQGHATDAVEAWKTAANGVIGKDTRCALSGLPCDGLAKGMGTGCPL